LKTETVRLSQEAITALFHRYLIDYIVGWTNSEVGILENPIPWIAEWEPLQ
jgi:hypothetical protein